MNQPSENAPHDPVWERTRLIGELQDSLTKNIESAPWLINFNNDLLACYHGIVEPYSDGQDLMYNQLSMYMIGKWAQDGTQRAALRFGTPMGSNIAAYDLTCTTESLSALSQAETSTDEQIAFMVKRSAYNLGDSKKFAKTVFGDPYVLSNWYTALRVPFGMASPKPRHRREEGLD